MAPNRPAYAPPTIAPSRWWWLAAPSPEEDAAYWQEQRLTAERTWRFLFALAVLCSLLWWPTDRLVYADDPFVRERLNWIRGADILFFSSGILLVSRVGVLKRNASTIFVGVVLLVCLTLGYLFGALGGPDSPWFYLLNPAVVAPAIISFRPVARVFVHVLVALMSTLGFFGLHPEHLRATGAGMALSFLAFVTLVSIAGGLLTEYWRREAFFLRRATGRQARELANLNQTLESRVAAQTAELRLLASHIESARESERAHIARELHDELGQELTALRYSLKFTRLRYGREPLEIKGNLDDVEGALSRVTTKMRGLVHELRPKALDDLGLFAAAEWLVKNFQQHTGLTCELSIPPDDPPLPLDAATAAYRILQEGLTNVARHAQATRIAITLRLEEGTLILRVEDNGTGFDPGQRSSGMGLVGMRERARAHGGTIQLDSAPGAGTRLEARLPGILAPREKTA